MKERKSKNIEKSKKINNSCQFIVKLVQMMKEYPKNVSWSDDGSLICFKNLDIIQNEVIPNYFRHRNMLSFVRQLNMYYFSKVESDDPNIMKFKHPIFLKGNQNNFHLIGRRNKTRDQIISGLQKNYAETLSLLQNQSKLSESIKSLIRVGLEYHLIALKNLKKMKGSIQELSDHLKSVRGKEIKNSVTKLKQQNMPSLNKIIEQGKSFQIFIKQLLCKDLNFVNYQTILPSYPSQMILFDEPRTIKDMQMNRIFNLRSEYSILNFKSQCSLDKNLKEDHFDKNQQISLQEDLKQQNQQQQQPHCRQI